MTEHFALWNTVGGWVTIGSDDVFEIYGRSQLDWVVIDLEHSCISLECAESGIRILNLLKKRIFVRLPNLHEYSHLTRVLDAGADGVICPFINDAEACSELVKRCKYPPSGTRGVGLSRSNLLGDSLGDRIEFVNNDLTIIAQIEHTDAVSDLDSILAVPGISGIFIGPYDLSASLGLAGDFESTEVKRDLEKCKEKAKEFGVPIGIHQVSSDYNSVQHKLSQGFDFVAFGLDTLFLKHGIQIKNEKI